MLNPEKWLSAFDSDGKVLGFRKALKLIILGGVDPSIRAEVWEFLLGCYTLSSTAEYRRHLRLARRERYDDLIRQCRTMHSSIGTGTLAYIVGSKVMDMRTSSKYNDTKEALTTIAVSQDTTNIIEAYSGRNNSFIDTSYQHKKHRSSNSLELYSFRISTGTIARDPSCAASPLQFNFPEEPETELDDHQYAADSFYDFPSLPVTNYFEKDDTDDYDSCLLDGRLSISKSSFRFRDEHVHSFQISNNVELIMEPNGSTNAIAKSHGTEFCTTFMKDQSNMPKEPGYEKVEFGKLRISDGRERANTEETTSNGSVVRDDRVSEWLWTLHRIAIDVVRTDSQLEFYEDSKNMARMSDILAVYAWIDPATGYCQGMSDLLSPFVVLYDDNADAFWCFEMLLRRMRENFQMEGPTGVMKQLQVLWKILERTDAVLFEHLSVIGAESLHFAFRMLLVLFRRELSFSEALFMWEMMWAADFDEDEVHHLGENCLEPLLLHVSGSETAEGSSDNGKRKFKNVLSRLRPETWMSGSNDRTSSGHPFCGLSGATFWTRHDQLQAYAGGAIRNGDDELSVFCVAAILIINKQKVMRETHSIDDIIKMCNDNMLKINVKRCIRLAIKLRKKYFYKLYKDRTSSFELS